jgi:hypothetical protein
MRLSALATCAALLAVLPLHAQSFTTHSCTGDGNSDEGFFSRLLGGANQVCELRSATVPLVNGHLNVNGVNGGIEVIGQDRQDIALEARVTVHAGSQSDAESLLHEVTIETGATIQAHGPQITFGNRGWNVSYRLLVPHHLAADFRTTNGGLTLTALDGFLHGETLNGGLTLDNLSGDVHVSTTNGGIHATLTGPTWRGAGLSATTTNGGISVSVPHPYSAHLVSSTVNGGISVLGAETGGRHRQVDTNLGSGGPTLRFETINGGVSVQ